MRTLLYAYSVRSNSYTEYVRTAQLWSTPAGPMCGNGGTWPPLGAVVTGRSLPKKVVKKKKSEILPRTNATSKLSSQ